ncbi:MAG: archease [Pirellulales bacterium]|nr:archease [Pirellulales bacterium]
MFEIFEHTADLGIRVEADSLSALLAEAAAALTSVLVANPGAIRPAQTIELTIDGTEPEELLVDWLSEVLWRFSAEHMLFSRFEVVEHGSHVAARLEGEPVDESRHQLDTEIKAITYHHLKVERRTDRWTAEVIVDL